jgi:signal transduction histidine kinase/DNA-binding CsgD family transcriptional regulator
MAIGLAARPLIHSTDAAPVAFATLVGPVAAPGHRTPKAERDLLATVAHELRNPLTSLRLSLDLLAQDYDELEPAAAARLIKRAQRGAQWLQAMTENLTSAACVASGSLDVRLSDVDVCECIDTAVLLVHGLLEERGQSVRIACTASSTVACADRARVVQVIANLLTNASHYSVAGDEIELCVSTVGQQLRIRVTDHGPGISPDDQRRIFGAWVRGQSTESGGLGLGLNIVQNLVQQQGGRVGVESTLGQGATFWFTLPAADYDSARVNTPAQQTSPRDEWPAITPDRDPLEELSQREREVACLVARGCSNRQIAAELIVSERTVDTHVSHILRKLELTSRAQIAVWVVERQRFNVLA